MPVPTYNELMRPVLAALDSGETLPVSQIKERVIDSLPDEAADTRATTPGGAPLLVRRIEWSVQYLLKAALIERPERAHYRITPRGSDVLTNGPATLDWRFLQTFPEFAGWLSRSNSVRPGRAGDGSAELGAQSDGDSTPDDLLSRGVAAIEARVIDELVEQLTQITPTQFERLVTRLLESIGYTGTEGVGEVTSGGADGGIDGIIRRDRLGLERILLQAKQWSADRPVGRPEIDKFLGVLGREGVSLGVFITTSSFTRDAREGVTHLGGQVALIDGQQLSQLMYEYDTGVSIESRFVTKRLDTDFFENL